MTVTMPMDRRDHVAEVEVPRPEPAEVVAYEPVIAFKPPADIGEEDRTFLIY